MFDFQLIDGIHVHLKPSLEITPLKLSAWYNKLLFCNDPRANWVLDGLANGFKVGFSGGQLTSATQNMHSACSHPEIVDDYYLKELKRGSIAGPFNALPSPSLYINRFGLIPKSEPNQWKMIIDLSFPAGASVDDFIPGIVVSVKYASVDDAIGFIIKCGRGTLMAKFDIKSAYRILPIHPSQRFLFSMHWKRQFFIDLCLAFGLRLACKIFSDLADILQWILQNWALIEFLLHYLNDFFVTGPPESDICQNNSSKAEMLCAELGVPLAEEKTVGPSNVITFLGIELNSIKFEARLPQDKLLKAKQSVKF